MLTRTLSTLLLGSFLLPFSMGFAGPPTIELVVPTYDYPQTGVANTIGWAIATNGTIAGTVTTPITSGFERFPDGTFSPTFAFPGAQATYVRGVNSSNLVSGTYYTISTEIHHGFFYDGHTYTQYDVPGATYTDVTGINNAGDFCGDSYVVSLVDATGFINVGGTLVTFSIPGQKGVFPSAVNNLGQVTGYYLDQRSRAHGFFRDSDGTLTYPLDPPGSTSTLINGINDKGIIVGSYADSVGTGNHAFVLKLPHSLISYDYPDPNASSLAFRGINNSGTITGSYHDDVAFTFHSFIAQLVR